MHRARVKMEVGALILATLVVASAGSRSRAHAQSWLPDRQYTEGPGIRLGDVELHPGVAVRGGYDTNVFRADGKNRDPVVINGRSIDVSQPIEGSAILAVTPHLNITTLGSQRSTQGEDGAGAVPLLPTIGFRSGLSATYFHYFVDGGPRNLEVDADALLAVLPRRPLNFELSAAYQRNVRPFTQNAGSRSAYGVNVITPRARVNFGSRSQILTGFVGYAPRVQIFESSVFDYLNNIQHGIEAGAAWKFLPNTALIYDAGFDFQNYSNDSLAELENSRSPILFSNNKRFRSRLGLNGALTRLLSFRALAGYAMGTYENPQIDEFEDVVAEVALTYRIGGVADNALELGYKRDVQSSAMGGWVRLDRGYIGVRALLGQVFLLSLEGGAAYVSYGRLIGVDRRGNDFDLVPLGSNNDTSRNDIRLDGALRGEYRVTNWLALIADLSVQAVVTDFEYAVYVSGVDANVVLPPDPADYLSFQAFGGMRFHY